LEHPSANAACAIFMMALQSTCGIVIGVADGARLEIIIIKAVGLTWIPRRRCCATLQDYAMMIILASSLIFPKFPESELSLLSLSCLLLKHLLYSNHPFLLSSSRPLSSWTTDWGVLIAFMSIKWCEVIPGMHVIGPTSRHDAVDKTGESG